MFSFITDHAADMSNQSPGQQYHIFKPSKEICVHIQQPYFNLYCMITHHAVKKPYFLINDIPMNLRQLHLFLIVCYDPLEGPLHLGLPLVQL